MGLKGQCHCGAMQFEVEAAPTSVTECNCTYCAKVGGLWSYYSPEQIRVTSQLTDGIYKPRLNTHHFCTTCGCTVYTVTPTWDPVTYEPDFTRPRWSVNARLFEDFDISTLMHLKVDGRHGW